MHSLVRFSLSALPLLVACSGGDPNPVIHHRQARAADSSGGTTAAPGGGGTGGASAVQQPVGNAGAVVGGAKPAAFTDAPAFASAPVEISAAAHHRAANVATVPDKNVDCLSCHTGAPAPKFSFAGTLYQTTAGTQGAPDVEVRILDANRKGMSVHTDQDGNFWFPDDGTIVKTPALVGARAAGGNQLMSGTVDKLGCNACHGGGLPMFGPG